jgi:hypothetical protein
MPMEPPKKPAPAPELKNLERLTGNWTSTAEMISPSKEEIMKHMPAGSKEPPSTFGSGNKTEWAMGGVGLKSEGWYEMGEGQKVNYVEYWTWDSKAKKYRTWYLSDWGESGTGLVTPCTDCDGFCVKGEGVDAQGNKKRMDGCFKFVDKDTVDWNFCEYNPWGKMSMKGTSKRQK